MVRRQHQNPRLGITRCNLHNGIENSETGTAPLGLHDDIPERLVRQQRRPPLPMLLCDDRADALLRDDSLGARDCFFKKCVTTGE